MLKFREVWGKLALVAALLLPFWFLAASLATKFGLIDWRAGFGMMTFTLGGPVIGAVLLLAIVALALALLVKPRAGIGRALLALAIPVAVAGTAFVLLIGPAQKAPFLHDVATDVNDPPRFGASILAARAAVAGGNGNEAMDAPLRTLPSYAAAAVSPRVAPVADKTVGELVRTGYPSLQPLKLALPPAEAFAKARAGAEAKGWTVSNADAAAGTFDATEELFWFGFKDDIAVRVRPAADGSVIDVRSASRVGLSDVGVNAKRVQDYLARLAAG